MRVGIIGTGAIARKHAQAYKNIGYEVVACHDVLADAGRAFAQQFGGECASSFEEVCRHPRVDFVDVCTFPDFRLQAVEECARHGKHVQVQKPMAVNLETARKMIDTARAADIRLAVVTQHRFDDSSLFLHRALVAGRLGRILQADAYVKWHRTDEYYARPIKGSWAGEGGGALIGQAIHQVDLLRWLVGPVRELTGYWQIGAAHRIESEDVVCAVMRYENGATGVIQAATAFWPGYPERIEIHGTKGTAIVAGDRLTAWDVRDDSGEPAPVSREVASGASDPMAISLAPFERQFLDFGDAIRNHREPAIPGEAGYQALELTLAVYRSCREGVKVTLG